MTKTPISTVCLALFLWAGAAHGVTDPPRNEYPEIAPPKELASETPAPPSPSEAEVPAEVPPSAAPGRADAVQIPAAPTSPAKAAAPSSPSAPAKAPPSAVPWRRDPSVRWHPGSYLGLGGGFALGSAWLQENDDHEALSYSGMPGFQVRVRAGDAFAEWFTLGFQIAFCRAWNESESSIAAFYLLLDTAFYPFGGGLRGLSLRPSLGLGFAYAQGDEDYKFGYGGPPTVSFTAQYEIRVLRRFYVAPYAQVLWLSKNDEDFDLVIFSFGLDLVKWFETATG